MKNTILFLFLLFSFNHALAQEKMVTKTGKIFFEASVPTFEEVKATNTNVSCILNIKTGEIRSLVLIKRFRFKLSLMEKHFNTNYINSNKYPKATLKGFIQRFNIDDINETPKEYVMKGEMEINGEKNAITTNVKLRKTNDYLEISSNFTINTEDFSIPIPAIVSSKISKTVSINTLFLLK